jgi:hypothetical protein
MGFEEFLNKLLQDTDFEIVLNTGLMKLKENVIVKISAAENTYKSHNDNSVGVQLNIEIINSITGVIDCDYFVYGAYVTEENLSVVRDSIEKYISYYK